MLPHVSDQKVNDENQIIISYSSYWHLYFVLIFIVFFVSTNEISHV